jgi:rRNA small subunit pseudouridine methyltransferase Nep1
MPGGLQAPSEEQEQEERLASGQGVIFCLEDAQLEVAQLGKVGRREEEVESCPQPSPCACSIKAAACPTQAYVLLNCDDHTGYLKKHKKDPALYRPDICHQASGRRGGRDICFIMQEGCNHCLSQDAAAGQGTGLMRH